MIAYIGVWLIVLLMSLTEVVRLDHKLSRVFSAFVFILVLLFIGTRYRTGPDIFNYETFYSQIPFFGEAVSNYKSYVYIPVEPLYMFLNAACKSLGLSFNEFLLFFSFLFIWPVFRIVRLYSPMPVFSIMIYLYYGYFSGFSVIRQVLAAAIFFYGIQFIIKRSLFKYILCMLGACCFHFSAVILFPLYFLATKKYKSTHILLLVGGAVVLRQLGIFNLLSEQIAKVLSLSPITFYLYMKFAGYSVVKNSFWGAITYEWLALICFLLYKREAIEKKVPAFNVFFNIYFMGIIVYAFFGAFGDFGRIIIYFKLAYLIVVPSLVYIYGDKKIKFMLIFMFSFLVLLRIYISIISDTGNEGVIINRYLPYKSWLLN